MYNNEGLRRGLIAFTPTGVFPSRPQNKLQNGKLFRECSFGALGINRIPSHLPPPRATLITSKATQYQRVDARPDSQCAGFGDVAQSLIVRATMLRHEPVSHTQAVKFDDLDCPLHRIWWKFDVLPEILRPRFASRLCEIFAYHAIFLQMRHMYFLR